MESSDRSGIPLRSTRRQSHFNLPLPITKISHPVIAAEGGRQHRLELVNLLAFRVCTRTRLPSPTAKTQIRPGSIDRQTTGTTTFTPHVCQDNGKTNKRASEKRTSGPVGSMTMSSNQTRATAMTERMRRVCPGGPCWFSDDVNEPNTKGAPAKGTKRNRPRMVVRTIS